MKDCLQSHTFDACGARSPPVCFLKGVSTSARRWTLGADEGHRRQPVTSRSRWNVGAGSCRLLLIRRRELYLLRKRERGRLIAVALDEYTADDEHGIVWRRNE
jgi:hypothetical protein